MYYLVTSVAIFAYVFVDWGQGQYLIREVARYPSRAGDLLGATLALRVVGGFAILLPVLLATLALGYDVRTRWLAAAAIVAALPTALLYSHACVFRGREHMGLEALVTVVAKAFTLAFSAAAIGLAGASLPALILAQGAGASAAAALAAALARRLPLPRLTASMRTARELLVGGTPFAALSLVVSAQAFVDAVVLSKLAPAAVVGSYGAARSIINALITPAAILGAAAFPRLARASLDPPAFSRELNAAVRPLLLLGAMGAAGTWVFADLAIGTVYGRESFAPAITLLRVFSPLLMLFFVDVLLGTAATVTRPGPVAAAKAGAIVATTVVSVLAVPWCQGRFGNGAIGSLLAFGFGEVLMIVVAFRLLPAGTVGWPLWRGLARATLAAAGTVLAVSVLPTQSVLLIAPGFLVAFGVLAYLLRLVTPAEVLKLGRQLLPEADSPRR